MNLLGLKPKQQTKAKSFFSGAKLGMSTRLLDLKKNLGGLEISCE